MATNDIKYVLNVQEVDNMVTVENKDDKIAVLVSAGRNYTLTGACIKVAGRDPSVGITLTSSSGVVTKITEDMWAVNKPSQLIFLIPAGLADGAYELKVTTQFSGTSTLLKTPRSVTQTLYIGEAPTGGGDTGGSTGGGSSDGDQNVNPLG